MDAIVWTGTKLIIGVCANEARIKCQELSRASRWLDADHVCTVNWNAHSRADAGPITLIWGPYFLVPPKLFWSDLKTDHSLWQSESESRDISSQVRPHTDCELLALSSDSAVNNTQWMGADFFLQSVRMQWASTLEGTQRTILFFRLLLVLGRGGGASQYFIVYLLCSVHCCNGNFLVFYSGSLLRCLLACFLLRCTRVYLSWKRHLLNAILSVHSASQRLHLTDRNNSACTPDFFFTTAHLQDILVGHFKSTILKIGKTHLFIVGGLRSDSYWC